MSDTTHTDDSMAAYLRDRIAQLDAEIAERKAQRGEVEQTLAVWTDGRSRVNRQRKARTAGNSTAPPPTQPGGYDDSVSLDEAQGVLAP